MLVQTEMSIFDHYILGEAFSRRFGAQCQPAIDKKTGRRCILKTYDIPRTETVSEAMRICDVFGSREELNNYYKMLSLELCRQAALMNVLSSTGGFSHYLNCQMLPLQDMGYRVCLLSPFEKTLAVQFEKELLSRKEIVRLGCELCASLIKAREAGYIYIGLKPENIFYTDKGYVIGDLGFFPLSSLPYRPLPRPHYSPYTPASSHDCYGVIPDNSDVFSLGKVLLQAYFGGQMHKKEVENDSPLLSVIRSACEPKGKDKYPSPESFADALSRCSLP